MGMFVKSGDDERKANYDSTPHWFGEDEKEVEIPKIGIKTSKGKDTLEKGHSWFGEKETDKKE